MSGCAARRAQRRSGLFLLREWNSPTTSTRGRTSTRRLTQAQDAAQRRTESTGTMPAARCTSTWASRSAARWSTCTPNGLVHPGHQAVEHHLRPCAAEARGYRSWWPGSTRRCPFVGTEWASRRRKGSGTPVADLYSLGKVLYELHTGFDWTSFPAMRRSKLRSRTSRRISWRTWNLIICKRPARRRRVGAASVRAGAARGIAVAPKWPFDPATAAGGKTRSGIPARGRRGDRGGGPRKCRLRLRTAGQPTRRCECA